MKTSISIAITHFNRFDLLVECLESIPNDPRISEIVISDDASTDGSYEKLYDRYAGKGKYMVFRNQVNLDCYRNKKQAVEGCSSEWVLLLDSDNMISEDYIDKIFNLGNWDKEVAYLPVFAEPHFDYRAFEFLYVNHFNVANLIPLPHFLTALNTANYFFCRQTYLDVWDGAVNPHTADSLFQNFNWIKKGNALYFVPALRYFHRVHNGSHYKNNVHKTGKLAENIKEQLLLMR